MSKSLGFSLHSRALLARSAPNEPYAAEDVHGNMPVSLQQCGGPLVSLPPRTLQQLLLCVVVLLVVLMVHVCVSTCEILLRKDSSLNIISTARV